MIGPSRCNFGFDAVLVDTRSDQVIAEAQSILGQETVPSSVWAGSFEAMTEEQKRSAERHCIAALRRGLSQALHKLPLYR